MSEMADHCDEPVNSPSVDTGTDKYHELAALLRTAGIVRSTADEAVVDSLGRTVPWGFYSSNVILTERGLYLAGQILLERLATFTSSQLAVFGYTAAPLLSACILLGEGRYSGLTIRDKPKAYLLRRLIDGPLDRGRSVVVIDDSISSGTSLRRSIHALENDGFEVEGAIALAMFSGRGGAEWAYRQGYRVDTVFDAWRDLEMAPAPPPRGIARDVWNDDATQIEPGLPPAVVARQVAEIYLGTGLAPRPPRRFDRQYDARGGTFVSFRERWTDHRVGRDGFWHFEPDDAEPCRDVVAATIRTIDRSNGAISLTALDGLKLGVTFLGPLELIEPARLDFATYGIVVRDRITGRKVGGALPNTQVFVGELEQYHHALVRNAGIRSTEPHDLFRHVVTKNIEAGETWLPYGVPDGSEMNWTDDPAVGRALIDRARSVIASGGPTVAAGDPLPDGLVPYPISGVSVGLYRRGPRGLGVAYEEGSLDALVCTAARRAATQAGEDDEPMSIVVTVLHDPELAASTTTAAAKLRRGLDALSSGDGKHRITALPSALIYNNLTKPAVVSALRAATEREGPWRTYRTTAWLSGEKGPSRLRFGFPVRPRRDGPGADDAIAMIELLAGYVCASIGPDGLPAYHFDPVKATTTRRGTSARVMSGLVALDKAGRLLGRADWVSTARPGLAYCLDHVGVGPTPGTLALPELRNGTMADCVLLEGAVAAGAPLSDHRAIDDLAKRVFGLFRPDGRICPRPVRLGVLQDHDFVPGAALVAAAAVAATGRHRLPEAMLGQALRWHRDRFRLLQTWAMAGWQPQGWAATARLTGAREQAELVFEVADWAIARQLEGNGAFLDDLGGLKAGFTSGFIAEGMAAAWRLASERHDRARTERYRRSWHAATQFLRTLVIHPEDCFCFADPERALGGVRMSVTRSDVRIDAVSHVLQALVYGAALEAQAG